MAVQERQARGSGYHSFSSRLQVDVYNAVNDWAWAGSEYKPEAGSGYCKAGS